MRVEITLPELGADPVVFSLWFVDPGDAIYEGDRVAEVLCNGATFDVSAPATGRFTEKRALPDDPLVPGQVLGVLETEETER